MSKQASRPSVGALNGEQDSSCQAKNFVRDYRREKQTESEAWKVVDFAVLTATAEKKPVGKHALSPHSWWKQQARRMGLTTFSRSFMAYFCHRAHYFSSCLVLKVLLAVVPWFYAAAL